MIFENVDFLVNYLANERQTKPDIKVLTTCGGFDPLHVGHLRCIRETAKMKFLYDDALCVIIVNGDDFLENKKGYSFMPEKERAEIISEIKGVDHVVIHYDGTQNCISAIRKIKPSVFTKGGDRDDRTKIPESVACDEVGCQLVLGVGGGKIQSSSELTKKAKTAEEQLSEICEACECTPCDCGFGSY